MYERKKPYIIAEKAGRKSWCSCGHSAKMPYCDNSHRKKAPGSHSIKVELTEDKTIAWCGCGESKNKPYCDGSHSKL